MFLMHNKPPSYRSIADTIVLIEVDSLKFDSLMVLMLDLLLMAELFAKERANSSKSFKSSAAVVLD